MAFVTQILASGPVLAKPGYLQRVVQVRGRELPYQRHLNKDPFPFWSPYCSPNYGWYLRVQLPHCVATLSVPCYVVQRDTLNLFSALPPPSLPRPRPVWWSCFVFSQNVNHLRFFFEEIPLQMTLFKLIFLRCFIYPDDQKTYSFPISECCYGGFLKFRFLDRCTKR